MRKITIATVACALLLLVTAALLFLSRRARPSEVRVVFCGFTNDIKGLRLAAFRVSNTGGVRLFRWPGYAIEERGRVAPPIHGFCSSGVLWPGESSICLLPEPSNNVPWRAVFTLSDNNWHRRLTGLPWVRGLLPDRFRSLPAHEGVSDWMGDISTVAAAPYRERVASVVVLSPRKPQRQTNATAQASAPNVVNPELERVHEALPATTSPR
jgi:hypothetical protein